MSETKTKKKRGKVLKVILWVVMIIAFLLLIACIIFYRHIYATYRILVGTNTLNQGSAGITYTEHTLTKEQMLSDFEYLYRNTCTDSLVAEQHEKYLKLDLKEIHDTYKARVENCKDEYEFFALLTSFMAKLPGGHNAVKLPTDNLNDEMIFSLNWEMGFDGVREANYAYWKQFEDRMMSYTQKSAVVSCYGGEYVFLPHNLGNETIDDIVCGKLLSLNGKPVSEVLPELDTIHPLTYDAHYEGMRVSEIFFNDGVGNKYEAKIEMPDGSIVNKMLYNSAEYNIALYAKKKLYPDNYPKPETDDDGSSKIPDFVTAPYFIETDPARKLVYINSSTCDSTETENIYNDITAAIEEVDAENIIIDIKNNGGGEFGFVTDGVCKAIFDGDVGWVNSALYPKTDIVKLLQDYELILNSMQPEDNGDTMRFFEDFRGHGEAKKKYNIYVLVSDSTFSSGDIMAGIASEQDNVTLLGENTQGEGFTGKPIDYYFPESKFAFTFTMSTSEHFPDDNLVGIIPDVYCPMTWEDFCLNRKMANDPELGYDYMKYENRQAWDRPLSEALKLIDSRSE